MRHAGLAGLSQWSMFITDTGQLSVLGRDGRESTWMNQTLSGDHIRREALIARSGFWSIKCKFTLVLLSTWDCLVWRSILMEDGLFSGWVAHFSVCLAEDPSGSRSVYLSSRGSVWLWSFWLGSAYLSSQRSFWGSYRAGIQSVWSSFFQLSTWEIHQPICRLICWSRVRPTVRLDVCLTSCRSAAKLAICVHLLSAQGLGVCLASLCEQLRVSLVGSLPVWLWSIWLGIFLNRVWLVRGPFISPDGGPAVHRVGFCLSSLGSSWPVGLGFIYLWA